VQAVIVTDDRQAAAERPAGEHRRTAAQKGAAEHEALLDVTQTLQTPYLLIGTPDEIAAQLRASRDRWDFPTSPSTSGASRSPR